MPKKGIVKSKGSLAHTRLTSCVSFCAGNIQLCKKEHSLFGNRQNEGKRSGGGSPCQGADSACADCSHPKAEELDSVSAHIRVGLRGLDKCIRID